MTKTASASGTTQKGLHRRPRIVLLCSAYPERIIQAMSSFLRPALVTALLLLPLLTVGPTSRLVQRIGHRPVLVVGGLIWGGAVLWFVERVGTTPAFVSEWLPGIVILGIGAGTLFPNLSGVAVASAPGESFATATGLNSVSRQVGAALGVALVVAIIGTLSPLEALAAFDHAWTFGAVCLVVAGLGCLLVGRVVTEAPSLGDAARLVLRAPVRSGEHT